MIRTETPGRAATLYEYDDLGNVTRTGLDVDGDGDLTLASMDRTSATKTHYRNLSGDWWLESSRSLFAHDNNAQETVISIQRRRLTGWKDHVIAERVAIDIHGNAMRSIVKLDRFKRTRIHTVHTPDSTIPSRSIFVNGRLAATTSKTGITMKYGYDALGRRVAMEDPRKGISTLHYDQTGRLDYVQDAAGNRARFEYDEATGRKIAEYNAVNKATRYEFNDRGQLIRTWGDVPYPVEYGYNEFGQMQVMRTFRGGSGWNGSVWPNHTGTGDQTLWHYQPSTGLLLAKEDAKSHRTRYAYGANGVLTTRTWARLKDGKPLQTSYQYDPATGDLTRIDYSDDTPDIALAYDRLGRKVRVSDAAGVHSFTYNDKLQLESEGLVGQQIYQLTRKYDELGRTRGFSLNDDYAVAYGYDGKGRFDRVDWQIGDQVGDAAYRYLDRSDRLAGMESTSGLAVRYAYEPHRDVKTAVVNTFKDRLISRYEYQYDRLARRINVTQSGEAFDKDGFWLYGYNDRHEITTASRFVGSDLKDQTRPMPDLERIYRYDPIGNRVDAYEGAKIIEYQTNELNQYERISGRKQQDQGLIYDEDGNLIEDDRFYYRWNGENRLVEVTPRNEGSKFVKIEFVYDYMGRRFCKKIYKTDDGKRKHADERFFIYNGWNMVKERQKGKKHDEDEFYVWGLDLSQSLNGAGGAGGLLATIKNALTSRYACDASGNVKQIIKVDSKSFLIGIDYDPFGETVGRTESVEDAFRYSSKYYDDEVDLYYFGGRYYTQQDGRWIKKDPIAENGGLNLFGYAYNSPGNFIDKNGFQAQSTNKVVDGYDDYTIDMGFVDALRIIYGLPFNVASGDLFHNQVEENYNDTQCEFLITITGIFTSMKGNEHFLNRIRRLPQYRSIQNATYVFNPSGLKILDTLQILGHEMGAIDVIAIEAAKKISNAAIKAQENKCGPCFTIEVVAHSQGTMVFKEAWNLLP